MHYVIGIAAAHQNQGGTPESDDVPEKVATSGWISATIGTVLLLLCVFLIAKEMEERQRQARFTRGVSRQISDVRQLILACRTYSADTSDVLPLSLQELFKHGYLDMPELLETRNTLSGLSEPYLYRPGYLGTDEQKTILIIAPESPKPGWRVVGRVGGDVAAEKISNDEVAELSAEKPTLNLE